MRVTKNWLFVLAIVGSGLASAAHADEKPKPMPQRIKHRITGLFSPEREQDFRDLCAKLKRFKLVEVDYAGAEAIFEYDPAKVWPGEKPARYLELFDNELRSASRGTFGAKRLPEIPADKLQWIEVGVEGLDCKGCAFAAYQMIYQLPGVEVATVSFKTGKVRAKIDPPKSTAARSKQL